MAESSEDPSNHPCEGCGSPMDASDAAPLTTLRCPRCDHPNLVNTQFHHFTLLEIIGSGGMGAVYRALDQSLNRTVALKLLRTEHMRDPSIVAQFEKEAAITAAINHPNVVRIFSTGSDRGTVYIVLELVDKGSLDDLMNLQGRISEAQVLEIGMLIARGLQAAWRAGLLHRDVKPGNILFNDAHTPKIVDFGLAALADEAGQIGGEVWGTPYYVAPEKLESPPQEDFRSDIYSLGSALFHAIAGRPPYEAEDASIVVLKALKSQPVSLQSFAPEVSSATNFVINRMLKKNPDERYQSYEELLEHLQYARREIAEGVVPPPPPPAPAKGSPWVTLGMGVLVVAAGLYFFLQQQRRRAAAPPAPITPAPVLMADAAERSAEARRLLLAGDPASAGRAAEAFGELDRETVPEPLRSWNALQGVLAQMLAGRVVEVPPASLADSLDPAAHETFGLLLSGVKDWTAGNFADAVQAFGRFQSATPEGAPAWIAEYQPLAASYITDHGAFTRATAAASAAATAPPQKKDALNAVRETRTQLKHQSPLAEQLAALETQLAGEVAAYEVEMATKMAALEAADAAALQAVQPRLDDFSRQLRIDEAIALAKTVQLRGGKHAPALEFMRRKLTWLANFKADFSNDLRTANYHAEMQTVTNVKLGPGLWVPNDLRIKVMTKDGNFETLWGNIHPQAIVTAFRAVLHPRLTAGQIADRQWGLGLYLLAQRRAADARPLLTEACAARDEYREALPQLALPTP